MQHHSSSGRKDYNTAYIIIVVVYASIITALTGWTTTEHIYLVCTINEVIARA